LPTGVQHMQVPVCWARPHPDCPRCDPVPDPRRMQILADVLGPRWVPFRLGVSVEAIFRLEVWKREHYDGHAIKATLRARSRPPSHNCHDVALEPGDTYMCLASRWCCARCPL
jgi:hypothetical protein